MKSSSKSEIRHAAPKERQSANPKPIRNTDLRLHLLAASILAAGAISLVAQPVASQFTTGAEDWTVVNWDGSGTAVVPSWNSSGGNPGGYVRCSDVHGDGFWRAPDSYHGDWSGSYGGTLSFDLLSLFDGWKMNDLYLVGNGQTLTYQFPTNPPTQWQARTVKLDATAGWQYGLNYDTVGTNATEAQIRAVLSNVTDLRIRQEYAWGGDDSGLDNVMVPAVVPVLRLLDSGRVGTNFSFSVPTGNNVAYTVEYNDDLRTTNWLFHHTLTGDGSLMSCLVPMTNTTQRFFRVRRP